MGKFLIRRLAEMILTLFLIATATFFLLEAVPGDPLSERADKLSPTVKENLYKKYGLDKPMMERYVLTMKGICVGDFGESFVYAGPIIDYLVIALSVLLISVPHLIFGLLLQKVFAGNLQWFPTIGWPAGKDLWFGGWEYTVLPTLTGCFTYIATYARLLKTSMLDVINQDYVLTAESKGLSRARIIRKHILRNSFIPVITQLPMSIAMCITGSFFIESIYSIPGIGQYYVTAVNNQDLSIIMGETVILAALYIVVLFITDLLYVAIDPRISMTGKSR